MSSKDIKTDNYHLMFGDCLERMNKTVANLTY